MKKRTEQLIILKLQSGDEEALTDLYHEYAEPIFRFILFRVGNNAAVAEDMMQEVFTKFIEVADRERLTHVQAYLYKYHQKPGKLP